MLNERVDPSPAAIESVRLGSSAPSNLITYFSLGIFVVISGQYFYRALFEAAHNSLWMDEIFAVWSARIPDVASIWSALKKGSDWSPPLFELLLHLMVRLGFHGPLAMRLPSIAAIYVAAIATGALVRRRSTWAIAAMAAAYVLSSGIFTYAIQARPYACVTAVIALALLLWDSLPRDQVPVWRILALAMLLSIAEALHFYAVVLVAGFVFAEIVFTVVNRQFRPAVLTALMIAQSSVLLWLPIVQADHWYLSQDCGSSSYYGKPVPGELLFIYLIFCWKAIYVVAVGAPMTAAMVVTGRYSGFVSSIDGRWIALAVLLASAPVAVYCFSLLITHSFVDRYTLIVVVGFALLAACIFEALGEMKNMAALAVLAVLSISDKHLQGGIVTGAPRRDAIALASTSPTDLPIATLSAGLFFEVTEAAPAVARRLVFLRSPAGSTDPTNQHAAERWAQIDQNLHEARIPDFMMAHPCFMLLSDPDDLHEDPMDWAFGRRMPIRWRVNGTARLGMVEARPGGCEGHLNQVR